MATPLQPKTIRNIGVNGLIRQAAVDDSLTPDGAVTEAINVNFDRIGVVQTRPGMVTIGTTIATGYPIQGLHNVSNGTLIAVFSQGGSARIYAYSSSWVSNLTSGTANTTKRFVEFAGKTIAINWGTATNQYSTMQFWSGRENNSTWTTTGNPINPQQIASNNIFPQFGEVHKSRVYLAGDANYPSRLFFSSVISSAGNITWAPTTDYVDINPGDGEDCTGLRRYSLELVFFKPNYIYRFRTSGVDPDPLIKIGTRSNESVVEGKRGLYFHHDTGFYRYSGGYPEEISRPIIDVIEAIPYSQFSIMSGWKDNDHIYWSLGDLTIAGETWVNVVARFTESSNIWTIYSYANEVKRGAIFNSSTAVSTVLGLDNGVVATQNSGTSDLGEVIKYRMTTVWYEMEGAATKKTINRAISLCEKAQDMQLFYQIDDNTAWYGWGQLRQYINFLESPTKPFHRIRFKIAGVTGVESAVFRGLDILEGINEGVVNP